LWHGHRRHVWSSLQNSFTRRAAARCCSRAGAGRSPPPCP
jgi:hypothetical protein